MIGGEARFVALGQKGKPGVTSSEQPQGWPKKKTKKRDPLIDHLLDGKYKIIDKLGEGGMGTVYRANQTSMDRLVAIKVLLGKLAEDEVSVKRFQLEARAVSKMQHPNTVTIYDYGQTADDRLYIVMEFLRGRTLTDDLRKDGPMDPAKTIHIIKQVCESLAGAHSAGIIHRDLKPDNIFLTEVGTDKNFAKVLDFGVAKLADGEAQATLTQTGMIFGTPKYMSPEQAEGKSIDFRADIYAIGVVMYELLTGRPPFLADTAVALLLKHISEQPSAFTKLRPDLNVPARLEAVTMKALAKLPDDRYDTIADLAADLETCLRELRTGPMPVVAASTQVGGVGAGTPMPTEVVPGQGVANQAGVVPPQAVPTGISLGVPAQQGATEMTPAGPAATQPASVADIHAAQPTAVQAPLAATLPDGGVASITPGGLTGPQIPGGGPAIETLGGVNLDASQPLRAPRRRNNGLLFGGIGAAALAGGIFVFVSVGKPGQPPTTQPLANPPTVGKPVTPPPVKPTPKPVVKKPDPVPSKPRPNRPTPKPVHKPRPERRPAVPAKAPEPARKVAFQFKSTPSGALVLLDGEQIGRTPFRREFAKSSDLVSFVFSKSGFKRATQVATLAGDRTVSVALDAKASSTPTPPKPVTRPKVDPKPRPTPKPATNELEERVDDLKDL